MRTAEREGVKAHKKQQDKEAPGCQQSEEAWAHPPAAQRNNPACILVSAFSLHSFEKEFSVA